MLQLLSLTAVLLSLAGPRAGEATKAPLPKPQESPQVDGEYTLNYTVQLSNADGGGWGAGGGPGGGAVPVTQTVLRSATATISKGTITFGTGDPRMSDVGLIESRFGRSRVGMNQTMTYAINPETTPISIDVFTVDARNKKEKSLGIIEVAENRITIALAKPGADRPKNMEEGENVTLYYFKKAPPPPRTEFRIVAMTAGKEAEAEKELNRLAKEGYELVTTTNPAAGAPPKSPPPVHIVLKRPV